MLTMAGRQRSVLVGSLETSRGRGICCPVVGYLQGLVRGIVARQAPYRVLVTVCEWGSHMVMSLVFCQRCLSDLGRSWGSFSVNLGYTQCYY